MNKNLSRLFEVASKKERLVVGLMSGTSLDGLDVALCKISGSGVQSRIKLLEFSTVPYPSTVKSKILEVFSKRLVDFEKLCILNAWIGNLHGEMVLSCLRKWKRKPSSIDLIASHGQTVFHSPALVHPKENINATLQIGDGDHIAVATGITTVSDFRQKHTAMGGEGAPLAVYGDFLLLSHATENRILLNMGGIANFTYLPAGRDAGKVMVTDTGPGNTLLDQFVRSEFPSRYFDKDSKIALRGEVEKNLLNELRADPFFGRPLPKSTGPELFNIDYLHRAQDRTNTRHLSQEDVLATLTCFSAETIAETILKVTRKQKFELYGSGGGMHNPLLIHLVNEFLGVSRIRSTDELGIPGDAKEAMLFAVLANETIAGQPIVFGKKAVIPAVLMGKISFPA